MIAWMTREALRETLETGRVCYYSRSRQKLWRKVKHLARSSTLLKLG